MKTWGRRGEVLAMTVCLCVLLSFPAFGTPLRKADREQAREGCTFVGLSGRYEQPDISQILELVNAIRKEACEQGVPDPNTPGRRLTIDDYLPVTWSGDMEWIAQLRAAEAIVLEGHTRPNGTSTFTVSHEGFTSDIETLAWNYSGILGGIRLWYQEKEDWVSQNTGEVTGHYTALINPRINRVGMAAFTPDEEGWQAVAGEYAYEPTLSEKPQGSYGPCIQLVEVEKTALRRLKITGKGSLCVSSELSLLPQAIVSYGEDERSVTLMGEPAWTSSQPSVAKVDQNGRISALSQGKTVITVTYPTGQTASKTFQVTKPKAGSRLTQGVLTFRVDRSGRSVTLVKGTPSSPVLSLPGKIRVGKKNYPVESIAGEAFAGNQALRSVALPGSLKSIGVGAFRGCRNLQSAKLGAGVNSIGARAFLGCVSLRSVTLPGRVSRVGERAFYGCKALEVLTVRTETLTWSSLGGRAFSKTALRRINVPDRLRSSYRILLRARGVGKKVRIR